MCIWGPLTHSCDLYHLYAEPAKGVYCGMAAESYDLEKIFEALSGAYLYPIKLHNINISIKFAIAWEITCAVNF